MVSCAAFGLAFSTAAMWGRAGRYMSMATEPNMVSAPSSSTSLQGALTRPARRGAAGAATAEPGATGKAASPRTASAWLGDEGMSAPA